jgi:2-keto-4-pentenoate hydratase/2-oxohepta-3-ene-1,7-dioic acid hydratase in catechol pathway
VTWALATYQRGGVVGLGALLVDGTLREPPELTRWASALEVFEDWPAAVDVLRGVEVGGAPTIAYDVLLAPIRWPRKVICAGVNYRRHIAEMGGAAPDGDWRPFFFLKTPTTTVIGPGDPIVLHDPVAARYDWEAELAVVIGIGGRDIPVARALDHVAGYCVANDVTARGLHKRVNVPAEAFVYDWYAAKSVDSSLPLGPGITPSFFVADPQDLRLRLWVNDDPQQDETTADMVCTVAELIAAASEVTRLEPGDVITTGTPSGVGAGRGLSLRAGDRVRTTIDGLGTLDNPVVDGGSRGAVPLAGSVGSVASPAGSASSAGSASPVGSAVSPADPSTDRSGGTP